MQNRNINTIAPRLSNFTSHHSRQAHRQAAHTFLLLAWLFMTSPIATGLSVGLQKDRRIITDHSSWGGFDLHPMHAYIGLAPQQMYTVPQSFICLRPRSSWVLVRSIGMSLAAMRAPPPVRSGFLSSVSYCSVCTSIFQSITFTDQHVSY